MNTTDFGVRFDRVRDAMSAQGIDTLLLSVGADLPWLTGYEAMPLERLTMLVIPRDGDPVLVIPRLEAPRVVERPELFAVRAWDEAEDPVDLVATRCRTSRRVAIGDQTWARFMIELGTQLPSARFEPASFLIAPLRAQKTPEEIACLTRAGAAADRVLGAVQDGTVTLAGRTEAAVAAELARSLLDEGHDRVNFTIVAAGANAASPHHDAGHRVIETGDIVLMDIGATMRSAEGEPGYCSDITRCVHIGAAPSDVRAAWAVLRDAQEEAVTAATAGTPCAEVDRVARTLIAGAGYGDRFIHRTGHGIGVEAHEEPYLVEGSPTALAEGHCFSVEPGIYTPGAWGMRLEDIVAVVDGAPVRLNHASRDLIEL